MKEAEIMRLLKLQAYTEITGIFVQCARTASSPVTTKMLPFFKFSELLASPEPVAANLKHVLNYQPVFGLGNRAV